jgi:hypothetical protein
MQPLSAKFIEYITRKDIHQMVQTKIVDPILNHVLQKIFPYVILICVLFILLLLAVLLTLGIIIFQVRGGGVGTVATLAATAAI